MTPTLWIVLLLCAFWSGRSHAHVGGLDSYGCHNNAALNAYECHKGTFVGRSWANPGGKAAMLAELTKPTPPVADAKPLPYGTVLSWERVPDVNGKPASYVVYWRKVPDPRNGPPSADALRWYGPLEVGTDTRLAMACILVGTTYEFFVHAVVDGQWSQPSNVLTYTAK